MFCGGRVAADGSSCTCGAGCHSCYLDGAGTMARCTKCRSSLALLDGECVEQDACTARGGTVRGTGSYGRECELPTSVVCAGRTNTLGQGCSCAQDAGLSSCHTCEVSLVGGHHTCLVCKNGQALLGGECLVTKTAITCSAAPESITTSTLRRRGPCFHCVDNKYVMLLVHIDHLPRMPIADEIISWLISEVSIIPSFCDAGDGFPLGGAWHACLSGCIADRPLRSK